MHVEVTQPDFLSLSELAHRWKYSEAYVHDLIREGKVVPAIALTDQERYVGGEFRGGYLVGDTGNAKHHSYSEYYVGTAVGEEDHYENRPQCNRIVFCHSPTDDPSGGYSFQFVSESADPGETTQWFYLDHAVRIGRVEGERRFRFVRPEIERFEAANVITDGEQAEGAPSTASVRSTGLPLPSQPPVEQRIVQNKLKTRDHLLDAEIEEAKTTALKPEDTNSVWAELVKLAELKKGWLRGVGDGEVKYEKEGEIAWFTKKNLRDRMRRAKTR